MVSVFGATGTDTKVRTVDPLWHSRSPYTSPATLEAAASRASKNAEEISRGD